jgi:carboxypeptidase Taq
MTLQELLDKYQELVLKRNAFSYADYLIGWDSETEAPAGCFENRSKMVGVLAGESFRLSTCQDTQELIDAFYQQFDELDDTMKLIIKKEKRSIDQMKKIPENEYIEYSMLMASAQQVWATAKHNNDFASFAPTLEKIVEFQRN